MGLFVDVLGTLVIRDDDAQLPRLPRYLRALLGYAAARADETLPREELALLLWPMNDDALHRLRHAIMQLRRALAGTADRHLIVTRDSVQLHGAVVDSQRFERLCRST